MSGRMALLALSVSVLCIGLLNGCDGGGAGSGPTPDQHDADPTAGHMVHPAGGPDSPDAKKASAAPSK